jgi:hypothetical protein
MSILITGGYKNKKNKKRNEIQGESPLFRYISISCHPTISLSPVPQFPFRGPNAKLLLLLWLPGADRMPG